MKYDELVKALRCVGFSKQCDTCKYSKGYDDNENPNGCDWVQLERDAAAAIEELDAEETRLLLLTSELQEKLMDAEAEVKRLELDNEDYEYTLRERYNETITLEQAIDRLHELGWLQEHDRILTEPKRGEWIRKDAELYYWHECSKCGERPLYDRYANKVLSAYCPNCGEAKMEVRDADK